MEEIWTTEPDEAETDFELIDTEPTLGEPNTTNSSDSSRPFVLVRYICGFIYYLSLTTTFTIPFWSFWYFGHVFLSM